MKAAVTSVPSPNYYLLCNYARGTELDVRIQVYRQRAFPHEAYILGEDRQ